MSTTSYMTKINKYEFLVETNDFKKRVELA